MHRVSLIVRFVLLAGLCLSTSCGSHDPFGCNQALTDADYEQAALACAVAYQETGTIKYAADVANAYYKLNDIEQTKTWIERLSGTEIEPELWSNLGRLLRSQGDYQSADAAFQQSHQLYALSEQYLGMAAAQYWRGYVAWETAEYKAALDFASASFDSAKKAGSNKREVYALYLLFSVFQDLGFHDSSEQILALIKQRVEEGDVSGKISYLVNESALRMSQQRMALARDSLHKSLLLATEQQSKRTLRSIYINLIEANLSLGDIESAGQQMEKAWQYMEANGRVQAPLLLNQAFIHSANAEYSQSLDVLESALQLDDVTPYWRWQIYNEIGRVAEAKSDISLLVQSYRNAIDTLEGFRNTLSLDELKASYLDKKRQPYEALFQHYASVGEALSALDIVEKAKARAFLDAYISSINSVVSKATAENAISVESAIVQAPKRIDVLTELLPAMNASPVVVPRSAQALLEGIGENHVLAYFEAKDRLWVLAVNASGVRVKPLDLGMAQIKNMISQFVANPDDDKMAAALGSLLLPIELLSSSTEKLYIVPDSTVGKLPFSALMVAGKRLVEDYVVSFVPSISSLIFIEQYPKLGNYSGPVLIGDPLNNLPAAKLEAVYLSKQVNGKMYAGMDATKEVFLNSGNASLLHIATHSGLSANGPWLELANGEITAAAIMANKVSPKLVTLASCSSAVTNNRNLWGSLGTAFLAAGSEAVLASLWSVNDQSTKEFMQEFYSNDALVSPALALAKTQRQHVEKGSMPSDWSGFILLGKI